MGHFRVQIHLSNPFHPSSLNCLDEGQRSTANNPCRDIKWLYTHVDPLYTMWIWVTFRIAGSLGNNGA